MLKFNDSELTKERETTQNLTLEELQKVVDSINSLLYSNGREPDTITHDLFQRFIWDYENLRYYYTINPLPQVIDADEYEVTENLTFSKKIK